MTTAGQEYIQATYGWITTQAQKPSEGSETTQTRPAREYIDRKIEAAWLRLRTEIDNESSD